MERSRIRRRRGVIHGQSSDRHQRIAATGVGERLHAHLHLFWFEVPIKLAYAQGFWREMTRNGLEIDGASAGYHVIAQAASIVEVYGDHTRAEFMQPGVLGRQTQIGLYLYMAGIVPKPKPLGGVVAK